MKIPITALLALVAVLGVACAGGDKQPDGDSVKAPPPTAQASPTDVPTATPVLPAAPTPRPGGGSTGNALLPLLFNNGLSGLGAGGDDPFGGLGQGDESLKQYLLKADDLPSDYSPFGEFTFRVPDGFSETGSADMAASMAMQGDPESGGLMDFSMLMSMAIRFDDLQALGDALGECPAEDQLQDVLAGGGGPGLEDLFQDVEILDASGLGEGGCGIALTMDLGAIVGAFAGDLGASDEVPESITMRMYFWGRGRYAGAIMRMGMGGTLSEDVDEFALAEIVDGRLASAP